MRPNLSDPAERAAYQQELRRLMRVPRVIGLLLTIEPHPDVAPWHDRGIGILSRDDMARWLDPAVPSRALLKPLPAGSLEVTQVA